MVSVLTRERILAGRRSAARRLGPVALFGSIVAATTGLAASNGGFFPSSWGWSSVGLFAVAIVALLLIPLERPRGLELALLGAVTAVAGWTWVSILWSSSQTQSVLEGERVLVLVAAVSAVLALAGRRPVGSLVVGVLVAVVAIAAYSLATRLFPDRFGGYHPADGYRLSGPIGYWNGLGIFTAMGVVLCAGVVTRSGLRWLRVAGAVAIVALLPTLYFTFSRGSWLALGLGLLVLLALDSRRLQVTVVLLALMPVPALAVLLASRPASLTKSGASLARAAHDGHRLALVLVVLALVQAAVAVALDLALGRVSVSRTVKIAYTSLLGACVVVVLAAAVVREGNPVTVARHAYRSFTAPTADQTTNLNQRLFTLSGNGRWSLWTVAWSEAEAHPVLGGGAGTFGQYWLEHRSAPVDVVDAHSLYVETLAELGPAGLAFVLALFALPLVAAVRNRRHPLVPAAGAAFAVYVAGTGVDWDWELAAVTLAALLVGMAAVLAPRESSEPAPRVRRSFRLAWVAPLVALTAVSAVGLVGNVAAGRSQSAAGAGDWKAAEANARQVIRWAPWSSAGWQDLGEAQLRQHQLAAAQVSIDKAIAKDPQNWVLWLDLASASSGQARVAPLDRAIELNPLSSDLHEFENEIGLGE